MRTHRVPAWSGAVCALVLGLWLCSPGRPAETWGYVTSLVGPNLLLDDGSLLRLAPGTRIVRADGSAGGVESISRGGRVVATRAADGSVAELRAYAPTATQRVYLSNLAPARGAAYVTTVRDAGGERSRSLALSRVTYTRPANWTQFISEVRYDPRGATGAPAAARFTLKDSFGDVIVERVAAAGQTVALNAGLDANATDRLTLEVAPAGEGQLAQDASLWLDPHFLIPPPAGVAPGFSRTFPARLTEALIKALGETRVDGLAVAEFAPVRVNRDQSFLRDLNEDLLVLFGRTYRVAGVYRNRLPIGTPVPDANRAELQKLGAAYVLVGTVSGRGEGTVYNAAVVQLDNGALLAAVSLVD
jgi:TolB-like protein